MVLTALFAVPFIAGLLAFALPTDRPQRPILVLGALAHLVLTGIAIAKQPAGELNGWIAIDPIGGIFLGLISVVFFVMAIYTVGYLKREVHGPRPDFVEGVLFSNAPERIFVGSLLFLLATMTLVTLSQHMGLLWVAIEATTLCSASLIYFHRHHRSLEAAWKYLLIISVGVALALLGTFFLAIAASNGTERTPLFINDLIGAGGSLHIEWLKAAFLLLLVGYGTKMGLAPFHTWLPDAQSESPSVIAALMSAALENCAFLAILRVYQIMLASGEGAFVRELLVIFGLGSMAVGAVFIMRQKDYKRMLAYSSIENMGILALGVGIGGSATFGALLHVIVHSFSKGLLFLVAGNILATFRTTSIRSVRGAIRVLPWSGPLWIVGFLAVTGTPPFGSFISEFIILQGALALDRTWIAIAYLLLLGIVFIGLATLVLPMAQGMPWTRPIRPTRESVLAIAPPVALGIGVLALGLYMPPALSAALHKAAALLGGS